MEADTVSGTLNTNSTVTRLIAREDIIAFSRLKNFRSYKRKKKIVTRIEGKMDSRFGQYEQPISAGRK
jgi:hypothetical protein